MVKKKTPIKKKSLIKKNQYEVYNFRFDEVMKHADNLTTPEEKILYLEYVKKDKTNNHDGMDLDFYSHGPNFEQKVENEISFIKKEMELKTKGMKTTENSGKIVWLKNRQDFVALFDVLMNNGFISYKKDKFVSLSKHFSWNDEEMKPEQLKHLKNNIKNKSEVHQLSDEMQIIVDNLQNQS